MKKTIKQMVEDILRNVPESRNSDVTLMIEIWRHYFPEAIKTGNSGQEGVWLEDLYKLPREDNVKRYRADLNAQGKYFPTDWEVAQARGIKEDEWRKDFGYPTKAKTKNPTKSDSYMDPQRSFSQTQFKL